MGCSSRRGRRVKEWQEWEEDRTAELAGRCTLRSGGRGQEGDEPGLGKGFDAGCHLDYLHSGREVSM